MRNAILVLFVTLGLGAGCGQDMEQNTADARTDGPSTVESFDDELPGFRTIICDHAVKCIGQDRAMCEAELDADMASAKAMLDDAGEMRCARCMDIKTAEIAKVVAANCNSAAGNAEAIFAACDLNRSVDYDGDDNPGNDDDEACAGFP